MVLYTLCAFFPYKFILQFFKILIMKKFVIYFEFYGRKLKTTVLSDNEENAKKEIKNKIVFHKIEKEKSQFNKDSDFFDIFMDIY